MNNYPFKRLSVLVIIVVLFWQMPGLPMGVDNVYAETDSPESPSIAITTAEKVDRYHEQTEKLLLDSAEWIDKFFGTENYTSEVNSTYLRVQLTGFLEDGEGFDFKSRFRLRLKLPNTEKRFRLTVASSPDEIEREDDTTDDPSDGTTIERLEEVDDNLTTALEYFFLDKQRHNMKFSVGATIRDSSLVGYGSTRYRYQVDVRRWTLRFVERVRWYTDDGWDARSELDFERSILDHLFFRTTPSLTWKEKEDGFTYSWNTSLFHPLNEKAALEYQFNNYFSTEISGRLKEANVRVKYRRQIWRKWLFMEIAPQLAWYESRDFKTIAGIMVRLEIYMGRFN